MFDIKKIDSFFSGEKNLLEEEEKIFISRRTKIVRFFKLFLPCMTALLLGLGIVLFDYESTPDSTLSLAEEDKIYFEKFRMKNTVFEITEKDNQYSVLKAQVVEETEPNTKIYDLTSPKAETLDKGKIVTASAQKGVYNQTTQKLDLIGDINVDYNHILKITTASATYNFLEETGYGHEQIIGKGDGRYFKADEFAFDKNQGILTLIHHVFLQNNDLELRTPDKAVLYINENKFISTNALVQKGKDTLKADKLTVYFKDTKNFEISKAYADGNTEIQSGGKKAYADHGEYIASLDQIKLVKNVRIVDASGYTASGDEGLWDNNKKCFTLKDNVLITDKSGYKATAKQGVYDLTKKTLTLKDNIRIVKGDSIITAPKAVYFQNKDEFRFYDHIHISQADGTAEAESGVYYVKKNFAELEHDVIITKKGNQVRGDKAISDFKTSKSRLIADKGKRVFGKLFESSFKKNSKDK